MPAGGNSRFRGYPARMSERQQLALLLQMTSQDMISGGNRTDGSNSSRSTTPQQHRGSKSRWANNKSGDQSLVSRKEEYRAQKVTGNEYEQNTKENNNACGSKESGETAAGSDSPRSPSETGAGTPPNDSYQDQAQSHSPHHFQHHNNYQQRPGGSAATPTAAEDSGAPCEMRRTPPQNKADRSATGQTGSSPRVTLRLNQVRGTRDDKKTNNSRQTSMSAPAAGQMDNNAKSSAASMSSTSSAPVTTSNSSSTVTTTTSGSSSTPDSSDVYEFKSSKEATPVRGSSSSPNPTGDKDKDGSKLSGIQSQTLSSISTTSSTTTASTESQNTTTTSSTTETQVTASPSSKRALEADNNDDQDEENRRKKRKESEGGKEGGKGGNTGRQSIARAAGNAGEKCTKSGKQASGSTANKANQDRGSTLASSTAAPPPSSSASSSSTSTTSAVSTATPTGTTSVDRKSPTVAASSPKPPSGSGTGSKTSTPAPGDSDGEEERPKSSDSSSAPKVPPLKIVIPQSTTSEQEQGVRSGKNTSTRGHQLPYVVPSSNSNDSSDKDQSQSASGIVSPTDGAVATKTEEKKDFSGAIHNEERSTHHQRVLRSSHRTSNGGNGSGSSKDSSSSQSTNVNYSNSSPLPAAAPTDRSNNSSPQQPPQQQQQQQQQQQPQQQQSSPPPDPSNTELNKATANSESSSATTKPSSTTEKFEKNVETNSGKNNKDQSENSENSSSTTSTTNSSVTTTAPTVELHPRKRKMKPNKETAASANESSETANAGPEVHPHDQPITNCYQLFLNIRKQIERRRKGLFPVQPKPPQGFKDYLMNRCTYVLAGNANKEPNINPPVALQGPMKDLFVDQEKERYRLRMQHVVEKEKLVLSVEQEILRVHGRAARALANQSLPFSVCTILKDEEVYNVITPEQEEKDRNARSRYNGRLFLSWLQDVDDKWEKIKEAMLLRHHNEAESLHAVQRMDWEWKLKEVGLCEFKATPHVEDIHVPMVHVSDDFDLLPA